MELGARLVVLGSLNMDISVNVPELPGPGATVLGGGAAFAAGGKGANQAVAAARLGTDTDTAADTAADTGTATGTDTDTDTDTGARASGGLTVAMVGCLGDDDFGRALRAALTAEGVDDRAVRTVPGAPTGIAMITVDQAGENMITVAPGANRAVSPDDAAAAARDATVLVISAEIPVPAILAALAGSGCPAPDAPDPVGGTRPLGCTRPAGEARPLGGTRPLTVLNLAPAPPEAARVVAAGPDWLVVNQSEAAAVLGRPVSGLADAARAASELVAAGAGNAVVTAGSAGAAYRCGPSGGTVPAFPVQAVDTVGAGDTFVGALAVALAAGIPPRDAVTAAAAAGAAAAAQPGTQPGMPRPADIRARTGYVWPL